MNTFFTHVSLSAVNLNSNPGMLYLMLIKFLLQDCMQQNIILPRNTSLNFGTVFKLPQGKIAGLLNTFLSCITPTNTHTFTSTSHFYCHTHTLCWPHPTHTDDNSNSSRYGENSHVLRSVKAWVQ